MAWEAKHGCKYCGSLNVVPVLAPETEHSPEEKEWECQDCDLAWDAETDGTEHLWDKERERYLKATTPKGR